MTEQEKEFMELYRNAARPIQEYVREMLMAGMKKERDNHGKTEEER